MNLETMSAIHAYKEEFTYYALEGDQGTFIDLARDLFVENHGEIEANKIAWEFICGYYAAIKFSIIQQEINER